MPQESTAPRMPPAVHCAVCLICSFVRRASLCDQQALCKSQIANTSACDQHRPAGFLHRAFGQLGLRPSLWVVFSGKGQRSKVKSRARNICEVHSPLPEASDFVSRLSRPQIETRSLGDRTRHVKSLRSQAQLRSESRDGRAKMRKVNS